MASYWKAAEANVFGVLGGLPETHGPDIAASARFLRALEALPKPVTTGRVLDAGAGVGRVAEALLLRRFEQVELLEPCRALLTEAQRLPASRFMCKALQRFTPQEVRPTTWHMWAIIGRTCKLIGHIQA